MATKTFYYSAGVVSGAVGVATSEINPGSNFTDLNCGWLTGTTAANNYGSLDALTIANSWSGTAQPDGSLVTTAYAGDFLRSPLPLTGRFDAGTWSFQLSVILNFLSLTPKGRGEFRLFKCSNIDGSGATELTSGIVEGTEVQVNGASQVDSIASVSLGEITLNEEYLIVQLAWKITQAGSGKGSATFTVYIRFGGTATQFSTPEFTPSTTQTQCLQPDLVESVADGTGFPWTTPENAERTEDYRAQWKTTIGNLLDGSGDRLRATQFKDGAGNAPNIPAGSTITSIKVEVDYQADQASAIIFTEVERCYSGAAAGSAQGYGDIFPTVLGRKTYTFTTGLPTVDQANDTTSGFELAVDNLLGNGETGQIEHMRLTYYFNPPPMLAISGVGRL